MGEDLIENKIIYVAELFGSDLQGNALYKLEPLKQIGNATFVKVNPEDLKKGDLAIFWNNGDGDDAAIRLYNKKGHECYYDSYGIGWENAIKFESKEQFEKILRGEI